MTYQLKSFRNEVAAAEARLLVARKNMTKAAERLGLPTAGIFSESNFVLRTTAVRWADRAEREGRHEGLNDGLLMAARIANGKSPFRHLKGVKLGLDQPATSATHAIVRAIVAASQTGRSGGLSNEAAGRAKQILDAAELARQGGPEQPSPEGLAKRIIAAGKRARGD